MGRKPVNAVKGQQGFQKTGMSKRGRNAPTSGSLTPSPAAATPGGAAGGRYDAAYRQFTYQPGEITDFDGYLERPSRSMLWRRRRGMTTRSAGNPAVRVSQFRYRGRTFAIEQHPSAVPVATTPNVPGLVNPNIKTPDRRVLLGAGPNGVMTHGRWIAAEGALGTTEGGDAVFVGQTRREVEQAIRDQIDFEQN